MNTADQEKLIQLRHEKYLADKARWDKHVAFFRVLEHQGKLQEALTLALRACAIWRQNDDKTRHFCASHYYMDNWGQVINMMAQDGIDFALNNNEEHLLLCLATNSPFYHFFFEIESEFGRKSIAQIMS